MASAKRNAWILLWFAVAAHPISGSSNRNDGADSKAPRIEASEHSIDFGSVFQGEQEARTYEIRNAGEAPLNIYQLLPNCACATVAIRTGEPRQEVVDNPNRNIMKTPLFALQPGESADIEVQYDATGQPVRIATKHVVIRSDDPDLPLMRLTLKIEIKRSFTLTPNPINFNNLIVGHEETREVELELSPGVELTLTGIEHSGDDLESKFSEVTDADGPTKYLIEITARGNPPLGQRSQTIVLTTDHARQKNIKVPVFLTVSPTIQVDTGNQFDPSFLRIGKIDRDGDTVRSFDIINHDAKTNFNIESIEIDSKHAEFISTRIQNVEEGQRYRVALVISRDLQAPFFRGTARIKTDHPDVGTLAVRFNGQR